MHEEEAEVRAQLDEQVHPAQVWAVQRGGWKIHFLRCSWEPNNFFLRAVSSALDLPIGPFGWVHILVSSDLKIWRPSNKISETLENMPVG